MPTTGDDVGKGESGRENKGRAQKANRAQKKIGAEWARVVERLRVRLGAEVFDSWFGRIKLDCAEGGVVTHTVPTTFLKSWINNHYRDVLLELWQKENRDVLRVDIIARSAVRRVRTEDPDKSASNKISGTGDPKKLNAHNKSREPRPFAQMMDQSGEFTGSPLDPRFTFANFVEGVSNDMCHAAARSVAQYGTGAVRFNPLFIHAPVGLGKTHLLQAIAWEARARAGERKVLYLTAEYFMWRFASAIRDHLALSFKEALRDIDILLIDDMQFLQGKSIQQEFCHLLNALIDSAKQVVVAADRPPLELESLDERVRSRLQGGVTLPITQPDMEMRKAILSMRYQAARTDDPSLNIPEDILDYVASQVVSSGRDVEGAFNQLLVQYRFAENGLTIDSLDRILGHLVSSAESRRVRIEDIQKAVARQYNVSRNDLLSDRRTRVIVRPRQIAMYLAKTLTPRSLPEIGRRFGGRDHTTVLHAVRKIEQLAANDPKLAREIELLKRLIEE